MKISEVLRSAARELCSYIDTVNQQIEWDHTDVMQPPELHDHQTCHELDLIANNHDKLVEALEALISSAENNSGHEPSLSLYQRTLDEAKEALKQAKDNQE